MSRILLEQITSEELIDRTADRILERIKDIISQPIQQETYLTAKETAKKLKISLPTLTKHCKSGLIPSYRIGRSLRYKDSEIQELVNQGLRFKPKYREGTK